MVDFADFVAPFDADAFRADYYGKRPLHISGTGRERTGILDWPRFNAALALASFWTEDTLKLYFKNRAALRDTYCDLADLRPGQSAPVNPERVKVLLGLGASLITNQLHRVCPEVNAVAHMLEREFAARVMANAYCSFNGVQAFQTHFDLHDVFAVQVEGEKLWRVYEARADTPVAPVPPGEAGEKWLLATRGRLLFEVRMKPGDILYLPRGQYHDALTAAQASLHVTFGVTPPTGLALFKLLENVMAGESAFRAALPDARRPGELRERLAVLADRLKAVLTSPAFALDVLNHQRGLAGTAPDYDLPAQMPSSWYATARPAKVLRRDAGFVLICDGREIALGAAYPAVEWLVQQRFFSLEDALARHPGVDRSELRAVLELLVGAKIVAPTQMQQ
ncbi:MAG: cupin domain-containing protein [Rhizomicrobium sp.]